MIDSPCLTQAIYSFMDEWGFNMACVEPGMGQLLTEDEVMLSVTSHPASLSADGLLGHATTMRSDALMVHRCPASLSSATALGAGGQADQ